MFIILKNFANSYNYRNVFVKIKKIIGNNNRLNQAKDSNY